MKYFDMVDVVSNLLQCIRDPALNVVSFGSHVMWSCSCIVGVTDFRLFFPSRARKFLLCVTQRIVFHPGRPCAGISFLFVLFHPCSSHMFLRSTCICCFLQAFLILPHILHNSCGSCFYYFFDPFFDCLFCHFSHDLACVVVFSYPVSYVTFHLFFLE